MSSNSERKNYYVYALSKTPVGEGGFDPASIFYVGKGKGLRWTQHFRDAQKAIEALDEDPTVTLSGKLTSIKDLKLDPKASGGGRIDAFERHAYMIKTNLTEEQALVLEALAIELLKKSGIELTNEVSGHHAAELLKPAAEVRRYYSATRIDVDRVRVNELEEFLPGGARGDHQLTIVVKGSTEDMSKYDDLFLDELEEGDPLIEEFFGDRDQNPRFGNGRVTASIGNRMESVRPGWNPDEPWTDEEARERARHYWPIKASNVEILHKIAADDRLSLRMLIQDPRAGQSALRYSWKVDPDGDWLDYGSRVGIPLGESYGEDEDDTLATTPHRSDDGKQLLEAQSNGIGYADFTNAVYYDDPEFSDTLDVEEQLKEEAEAEGEEE